MYVLDYESRLALEQQLLQYNRQTRKENLVGLRNLYHRWADFGSDLLESEEINHLWSIKSFRDAYYSVTVIVKEINDVNDNPKGSYAVDLINEIIEEIEEGNDTMYQQLVEAANLIANTKGDDSDSDYTSLVRDLDSFLIIRKCLTRMDSVRETHSTELLKFLNFDKDKRKPAMAAA